jgi:uncharacterized protein YjbI with pentapeptide repeats
MADETRKHSSVSIFFQAVFDSLIRRRGWDAIGAAYWRAPHAIFVWPILFVLAASMVAICHEIWLLSWRIAEATNAGQPDDINKLLLSLVGIIGAPFVVWRVLIAAKANSIAEASAAEKARIDIQNLQSTLLTKAVEQLGAMREEKRTVEETGEDGKIKRETISNTVPNTEVRLGAIYALEKLARDSEELHWPIMEILCAYVRKNAGPARPRTPEVAKAYIIDEDERTDDEKALIALHENKNLAAPFVDVQAALTVIGRRPEIRRDFEMRSRETAMNGQEYRLDLSRCHLSLARLDGLHFQNAIFTASCLEGAFLLGTHLENALLSHANFENGYLGGAFLNSAFLFNSNLEGASFENASLTGAYLSQANLSNASLNGAILEDADLHRAYLAGASFGSANLKNSRLNRTHLEAANFDQAILDGAELLFADLQGASFHNAQLVLASFTSANLEDARLDGANLTGAEGIIDTQIASAWGNAETVLPNGTEPPLNERWASGLRINEENMKRIFRWINRRDYWLAEAKKRRSRPNESIDLSAS